MAVGVASAVTYTGSEGGFLPPSLTGCALWLRADLGVTTTAGVARWLDQSASLAHVSQDTAADKPARGGAGAAQGLDFDGVSELMVGPTLAGLGGAHTIGIALQALSDNSGAASAWYLFCAGSPNANGVVFGITNHSPARRRTTTCDGTAQLADWGSATTSPETWVERHDGAGGNADFCLNGSHQAPQLTAQAVAPSASTAIGARAGTILPANVRIWAVIAYDVRLSDADTLQLSQYLTDLRNGITPTVALPGAPVLHLERPDLWAGESVSAWANQGSLASNFAQAVAASQPALIPGHSGLASMPGIHADAVADRLDWSGAANALNFLHNGAGGTLVVIGNRESGGQWFGDLRNANTRVGTDYGPQGAAEIALMVGNGGGIAHVVAQTTATAPWPVGSSRSSIVRLQTGAPNEYDVRVAGVQELNGAFAVAPSAANPFGTPALFSWPTGGSNVGGTMPEVIAYNRYLTDAECAAIEAYAAGRYGL
jgi:hypothetical protein